MSDIIDHIASGGSPSMSDIIDDLGDRLPLLHELEGTPQDPEWHAEGNVLIHTQMVLDETYKLLDADLNGISPARRAALVMGSAFHDIAKPTTTKEREIDGRIRLVCPRHELQGRSYLALQLAGTMRFPLLNSVMALTGYHNALKKLVLRNQSPGAYRRLSRVVDLELIYWLEVADIRGRECRDKETQLEHLEMFRMFAEEYDVWHTQERDLWNDEIREALAGHSGATIDLVVAKATSDREDGVIATPEEAIAKSYGYRDEFPEVVVTTGLSGSGKTTWIGKNLGDHKVVSLDDIRASLSRREDQQNNSKVLRMAKEELREHLRAKRKVVWDATSLRTDFRSAVIAMAVDYGALVTIAAFHCPSEEIAKRNRARSHPVSAAVRLKQARGTQWPEITEAHRFLSIDENGKLLAMHGCPSGVPYGIEASDDV